MSKTLRLTRDPEASRVVQWQTQKSVVLQDHDIAAKMPPQFSELVISSLSAVTPKQLLELLGLDVRVVAVEEGFDCRKSTGLGDIEHKFLLRLKPWLKTLINAPSAAPGAATETAERERLISNAIDAQGTINDLRGELAALKEQHDALRTVLGVDGGSLVDAVRDLISAYQEAQSGSIDLSDMGTAPEPGESGPALSPVQPVKRGPGRPKKDKPEGEQ